MHEYLQHHFSLIDHGLWRAPKGVGAAVPPDWKMDGMAEVRLRGLMAGLLTRISQLKAIFRDEENIFDRCLANLTNPGGGFWWTGPYQPAVGFRAAVFLRARHEFRGRSFRRFVGETMAPALIAAGARELRVHNFQPGGRFLHWTPGVRHDEPVNRRYDCALVVGTRDRAEFDRLLVASTVQSTESAQLRHCVAIHAYAVENTYPVVLNGEPQAVTLG